MTIRSGLGHIQIYNAEYFQRDESACSLTAWRTTATCRRRRQDAARTGTAPRIEFYA